MSVEEMTAGIEEEISQGCRLFCVQKLLHTPQVHSFVAKYNAICTLNSQL